MAHPPGRLTFSVPLVQSHDRGCWIVVSPNVIVSRRIYRADTDAGSSERQRNRFDHPATFEKLPGVPVSHSSRLSAMMVNATADTSSASTMRCINFINGSMVMTSGSGSGSGSGSSAAFFFIARWAK